LQKVTIAAVGGRALSSSSAVCPLAACVPAPPALAHPNAESISRLKATASSGSTRNSACGTG
jgi:hypothetical protein